MQYSSVGCSLARWKNVCPKRPELGTEGRHIVSGNSRFLFLGEQRSCDGRGARSAPSGVAVSPKRRVRAAHGRAREAKTHYLSYIYLGSSVCLSSCHIPSCRPVIFLSSCHICGTLSYSLCFNSQADQGAETEGFEREGL
jgi:hypothetical protein